ncbi:MAG: T9SS type A sorting domain-containing protein, partial [candidate division WOR-3 bacterium]
YSPTISCDETGRLVVVWCDFRNFDDDPEIYAQAFNSNLSPIDNNQMVNQSDLFLANNQWLIGQGVSCNNRRIGFAWIDNRRHQGWDIYAKIVQWAYFTAVDDNLTQAQTNSLTIFPNPTAGKILLKSNNRTIKDLQLFNSLGSKVANISIKDYQQQKDLQIDLSHLTAGVYFLRYNLEDKSETKKIILNTRRERENN